MEASGKVHWCNVPQITGFSLIVTVCKYSALFPPSDVGHSGNAIALPEWSAFPVKQRDEKAVAEHLYGSLNGLELFVMTMETGLKVRDRGGEKKTIDIMKRNKLWEHPFCRIRQKY